MAQMPKTFAGDVMLPSMRARPWMVTLEACNGLYSPNLGRRTAQCEGATCGTTTMLTPLQEVQDVCRVPTPLPRWQGKLTDPWSLRGRAWTEADEWPTRYVRKRCANLLKGISAKTECFTTYLDDFPVQIEDLRTLLNETEPDVVGASCVTAMPTKF